MSNQRAASGAAEILGRDSRHAARVAAVFGALVITILAIDVSASRRWDAALQRASARLMKSDNPPPTDRPELSPGESRADMLRRSPNRSIVIVGSSIVMTGVEPSVLRTALNLDDDVEALVFGRYGGDSGHLLQQLAATPWRPRVVVVDVGPRNVSSFAEPTLDPRVVEIAPRSRFALGGAIDTWIEGQWRALFPWTASGNDTHAQVLAIVGGLRHGTMEYACAVRENAFRYRTDDGGAHSFVLAPRARMGSTRRQNMARTGELIRRGSPSMEAHVAALLRTSRRLASEGTDVIIANFPIAPELRAVDQAENAPEYEALIAGIAAIPNVHWIDLGADSELAALPFYDGHHRDCRMTVAATPRIAELLRPFIPAELRR